VLLKKKKKKKIKNLIYLAPQLQAFSDKAAQLGNPQLLFWAHFPPQLEQPAVFCPVGFVTSLFVKAIVVTPITETTRTTISAITINFILLPP
jgi:hypothetical protein